MVNVVGINEMNEDNAVFVYPNPVANDLQIQTTLQIKNIAITDITGRVICTTTTKTINCSSFADGVYFVKVITTKGFTVKKIEKE
jgi:hypothetical protein